MFKSFIVISALFTGLTVFQTPAQAYCATNDTACWNRADQREMQEQLNEIRRQQQTRHPINMGGGATCSYTMCY